MRIGLISDTHIPVATDKIPPQVKEVFQGVDLILHAGDIYVVRVLDELQSIAPVLAARGDDDFGAVVADERVEEEHSLLFGGIRVSLSHVIEHPQLLRDRMRSLRARTPPQQHPNLTKEWSGNVTDIFVFGDTHQDIIDYYQGFLLVNPGSPTLPNYISKPGTVGLLTITPGKVEAQIIQLG